jgi:hypothetical protein
VGGDQLRLREAYTHSSRPRTRRDPKARPATLEWPPWDCAISGRVQLYLIQYGLPIVIGPKTAALSTAAFLAELMSAASSIVDLYNLTLDGGSQGNASNFHGQIKLLNAIHGIKP